MIDPVTAEELRSVPAFSPLADADLNALAHRCIKVHVNEGAILIHRGESGFKLFVVLHGQADVVVDGTVVAAVGEGELLGEMALLSGEVRNADVIAASPMLLAAVMVWDFQDLQRQHPAVISRVAEVAEQRRN